MLSAIGSPGTYGAAEEALVNAVERALAGLGIGTALALALGGVVLGAEALAGRGRGRTESRNAGPPPDAPRRRVNEAFR